MSREATKRLYDLLEQGFITADAVVDMCMDAMSEDDVRDMLDNNELSERFFEDEDDSDEDDDEEWDAMEPSLVDAEPELEDYASSECPDDCSQCEYTGRCKTEAME